MILNKVLSGIEITLGNDKNIAEIVERSGNRHINTKSGNICIDLKNKIFTSPCFMLTKNPAVVYEEVCEIIKSAVESV